MSKPLNIESDIFLIDSSSYFYRAFYALPPLVNSKGFPTGAILGYARMLIKLKTKFNIKYGACIFDSRKSLRKELYKDYKANRIEMPEDLVKQVDYITLISNFLGFKTFKLEGYEADDLIAFITEKFSKSSKTACIVTSDKDLKQLLSPNVCIYDAQKDVLITDELFKNTYGIKPEAFKYILALMGDVSDNIPGIKGIGEKTALSLIRTYGSLDGIYNGLDLMKQSKIKELLAAHKEDAYNSLKLASFYKDLPFEQSYFVPQLSLNTAENCNLDSNSNNIIDSSSIIINNNDNNINSANIGKDFTVQNYTENSKNLNSDGNADCNNRNIGCNISYIYDKVQRIENLEDFALEQQNNDGLYKIFKEFEFYSLIKQLNLDSNLKSDNIESHNNSHSRGYAEASCNIKELSKICENELAIYIGCSDIINRSGGNAGCESGVKQLKLKKTGYSNNADNGDNLLDYADKMEEKVYLFSNKNGYLNINLEDFLKNKDIIAELTDETVKKIGYDINSIRSYLKYYNISLNNGFFDIAIASYLLNPIIHNHTFEDIINEFSEKLDGLREISADAKENKAFLLYFIFRLQLKELEKDNELKKIFFGIDMPLAAILADIEETGFMVDKDKLFVLSAELELEAQKMAAAIYKIAGREFNINSPKQLSEVMFDELKFQRIKKNSTDIEVLLKLKNDLELLSDAYLKDGNGSASAYKDYLLFLDSIISYRNKIKLKTSFTDVLLKKLDRNSRIHTSFSQIKTSTGRLASKDPNLQNIPITGIEGKKIRQAFIAPDGKLLISADYSQIDLRVMASISKDSSLIESFKNNEDIHLKTASEVFGIKSEDIDADMRRKAKVINFGIIYGMSPYGLSKELNITQKEAKIYIDSFFEKHSAVKYYMENIVKEAKKNGYVKTLFGRRCYIKDINSSAKNISPFAERAAINAPIQGTAADIIKIAMVNIYNELKNKQLKTEMILQIHDELIFEAEMSEVEVLEDIIKSKMTDKTLLSDVPLVINIGKGKNWDEAH